MNTSGLLKSMRSMRIIVVFLALMLAYGAVSYSPQASAPIKLFSIGLGGVTGATNNTVLAYGRFVLIAPFWPSKGVAENGDLDLTQLDNYKLYLVDARKPNAPLLSKDLSGWNSKLGAVEKVFFPTKVVFDPQSSNIYVRGTRFEEREGEVVPIDVIAYVRLSLDTDGTPLFDTTAVSIDIPGVSSQYTDAAPLDFALTRTEKGDMLVFTNGASIFSFNLALGTIYGAEIVHPSAYSNDDTISFLDVDSATNVVTVCENRKSPGQDKVVKLSSEISFYKLGEYGTFDLLKRAYADQFPDGAALASGSNVAIASDADSEFSLFITNDGSLCTVDLQDAGVLTTVKRLYTFPELASATDPSPVLTQYDSSKRTIGIVKPGFTVQISRPSNGKRGRISRPSNLHITSETPVLAMAKLSKKNRVTSVNSFTQDFKDEGGLSNFVNGQDSQWLISTYSGKLYSVGIGGDLHDSKLQLVGSIGDKVARIDYYADRTSIAAINSFTLDADGIRVASPGSLVLGRMSDTQTQSNSGAILQALLPTASLLGKPATSIRRPCNVKR